MEPVPVMRPRLPRAERVLPRLRAIDAAGTYANLGPQEHELRERFADLLGVDPQRVVTTSNATAALAGAAALAGPRTWAMPSFTFTATPAALRSSGSAVRFADVDDDWWLDRSVASEAEAVVPVAPFGADVALDAWPIERPVIIDAAASLGHVPQLGALPETWSVVFSLHATKVLGIGEGGLVITGDAESGQRLRAWTNFGLEGSRASSLLGTNAKLSEFAAAHAHAALDEWEHERSEWLASRRLVERIAQELHLVGRPDDVGGVTPYWVVLLPDAATVAAVSSTLERRGIGSRQWWPVGCHRMPAYADIEHGPLTRTDDLAARCLGLPFFRGMTAIEADRIAEALGTARTRTGAW